MVLETLELASITLENIPYLFFEILLFFWQRIILELRSLLLPDDLMYATTEHGWALLATRSFVFLTVAKYRKKRIIYHHLSHQIGLELHLLCCSSIRSYSSVLGAGSGLL